MNLLGKILSLLGYICGGIIIVGFIFIAVNQKKIEQNIELKNKSVCIAAGENVGLKLAQDDAYVLAIGLTTPKAGVNKTVIMWEESKVKCTLFRSEIDNFVVNGEDLTGSVRRDLSNLP